MEKFAYLVRQPKTKYDKRIVLRQANKIESIFKPIEESFIINVFTSNENHKTAYLTHLNAFKDNCEWIRESGKFAWFKINEKYFVNQYKPIEE